MEYVMAAYTIIYSADNAWYCIPELMDRREGGIWLGVERCPLPVPPELHAPGIQGAAVMRGRNYWRRYSALPHRQNPTIGSIGEEDGEDKALVEDYLSAAWWTPGL